MAVQANYHEQLKIEYIEKLREMLKELPVFVEEYMRGANRISSNKTKVSYAYDYKVFFGFLCSRRPEFEGKTPRQFTLRDLESVSSDDIDTFLEYVSYYENPEINKRYLNDERTKARKLSSIRSLYTYFYKRKKISQNPSDFVIPPKIKEKNIISLEVDEVASLLDSVESGEKLTKKQKEYHEYTQKRDLAIVTLLLGTGIRVSECVGIDIKDIDFEQNGIKILRKGGNESTVYFGEEVRESILDYIEYRRKNHSLHEPALFISLQNKRINVRSVQNIVKKYASSVTALKEISPHKLRSTYGTNLYNETGDIYLVAAALGHSDVNTTTRHYAKMDDQRRRQASKYVKLRKD